MISPDEWRALEPLLDAVLDAAPGRRSALLADLTAGDEARRSELEGMLSECEGEHGLFGRPAGERFAALLEEPGVPFPVALADRYQVQGEVGRGGMATVFLARDLKHGRDVAVKVVRPGLVPSQRRERFRREIEIVARLRHPHIVPLYDSGEADGALYFVMPLEEGRSLRERLAREGPLPLDEALTILQEVCDALSYAHAQGIVHCDIKPGNVLLSARHAMVTDFGIARALGGTPSGEPGAGPEAPSGTPAYMAPEQVTGASPVDHRADVYAFGVLAYEVLSGSPPFDGRTRGELLEAHLGHEPRPLALVGVPPAVSDVIMKCLRKSPGDRWQRADEVREALRRAVVPDARNRTHMRWMTLAAVLPLAAAAGVFLTRERNAPRGLIPGVSAPALAVGLLPVSVSTPRGDLGWIRGPLEGRLQAGLAGIHGVDPLPARTIASSVGRGWPLDSVAWVLGVDYFVEVTLSRARGDSILASLALIEHGIRTARGGSFSWWDPASDVVDGLGRAILDTLRPMLGARVRERQLESGTTNARALALRRQADHHRLAVRDSIVAGNLRGADSALRQAQAALGGSAQLDTAWTAPWLALAALSEWRALILLNTRGTRPEDVRAALDTGIALVDSVLRRDGVSAAALALRGRLRWQRLSHEAPGSRDPGPAVDSVVRDLEQSLRLDTTLARAAADLSEVMFERARFDSAAALAERAYRLDAYMEKWGDIVNGLAQSRLELGDDAGARHWCLEGLRRNPRNPAHHGCLLEVMAWGDGPVVADSAWAYYRALLARVGRENVSAHAGYRVLVAGALLKAPGVPADSVRNVLAAARSLLAARPDSQSVSVELLAPEAAVLHRMGDREGARLLVQELRDHDPGRVDRLLRRRMLRGRGSAPR
jgi:serine/threonine-protein kinase